MYCIIIIENSKTVKDTSTCLEWLVHVGPYILRLEIMQGQISVQRFL